SRSVVHRLHDLRRHQGGGKGGICAGGVDERLDPQFFEIVPSLYGGREGLSREPSAQPSSQQGQGRNALKKTATVGHSFTSEGPSCMNLPQIGRTYRR